MADRLSDAPSRAPLVRTLEEVAEMFGLKTRTLARRRQGNRIVFDDGRVMHVICNGRRTWVAEAELRRFLGGETTVAS